VQEDQASNASSGDKDCSRIVSEKGNDQGLENQSNTSEDESSRSRNECNDKSTYGDDTDITPSYDTEPIVENDQNVVECDDERVALDNLIANLKLDVDENKKIQKQLKKSNTTLAQELKECKSILVETSRTLRESYSIRDSCLVALQSKQTEFEKYKACNDCTVDYDKLKLGYTFSWDLKIVEKDERFYTLDFWWKSEEKWRKVAATHQRVYHPQPKPTHYTQSSSTRSQAATRNKRKEISNIPPLKYDSEPEAVSDEEATPRDKEIEKLMALILMDQNSAAQCFNCKELGHVARECKKEKWVYYIERLNHNLFSCKPIGLAGDLGSPNDVLILLFEKEETNTMGEPTMEEYMTKTRDGYGFGIARPKIDEKAQFKLKGHFLKELHDNTFSGLDHKDANEHIDKVLEIVDLFHIPNITQDLEPDETLYQAWERFKELLMRCPQHYLTDMQEVILFYMGLETNGEALILNRSLDPLYGDYIELNDPNEPLELRRNQVDYLEPTMKEGELVDKPMMDIDKTRWYEYVNANFFPLLSINVMSKRFYNLIMKDKVEYKGKNIAGAFIKVPIFVVKFYTMTDFAVVKNMDAYRDDGMGDIIVGRPFCRKACVKARQFDGMITIHIGNDSVTYQMTRSHLRFKHLTNAQCNMMRPSLKVSAQDELKGISHPYQKLKGFYKEVLNLGSEYIKKEKVKEWLTHGHVSIHEME
nr:homeodomain-like protein [Tanacetum cinerariifolium]